MIDHIGICTINFENCINFYTSVLATLNYKKMAEYPTGVGFGSGNQTIFWVNQSKMTTSNLHISFKATNRTMVDNFYQEALKAGGKDNGAPGLRSHYHADYYAAFIIDLDGNNIEAVCHNPS